MVRMRRLRYTALLVMALQTAGLTPAPLLATRAAAQPAAFSSAVRQGWEFWRDEKYNEAITTLRNALKDPALVPHDRTRALAIIGQCHLRMADEGAAIAAFHELLDIDREWKPDPDVFQPDEVAAFEKARAAWTPPKAPSRPLWKKPWVLGLVTLGVGVAGFSLLQDEEKTQPPSILPDPPGPPPGN